MDRIVLRALLVTPLVMASAAQADVADYCAAYARDIADASALKKSNWQQRYDNAEATCVARYTTTVTKVKASPRKQVKPVKPAAPPPVKKPKVKVAVEKPEKPVVEEKQAAKALPLLKEGSAQWLAFCKDKYVSFNTSTGTYTSKTGKERPCLVPSDRRAPKEDKP